MRGDSEGAYRKLRELVKIDTNHIGAYIRLGDILREKEKADQAVKIHQSLIFRRGLTTDQKVEIHTSLAKDYYSIEKFSRAEQYANQVLRFDKKNVWAAEYLLRICEDQKRWTDATEYLRKFERVSGKSEKRRRAYYRMMEGQKREEEGKFDDARSDYSQAVKLDETYADPHLYLGNLHEREKDLGSAVKNWMQFAELSPGSGKQVFERIEKALFEMGRFSETETFYRKVIATDPNNIDAIARLVDVLEAKGEIDKALALLEEALVKNDRSILARLSHLKLSLRKQDQDDLSAKVNEIVQMISKNSGSLAGLS